MYLRHVHRCLQNTSERLPGVESATLLTLPQCRRRRANSVQTGAALLHFRCSHSPPPYLHVGTVQRVPVIQLRRSGDASSSVAILPARVLTREGAPLHLADIQYTLHYFVGQMLHLRPRRHQTRHLAVESHFPRELSSGSANLPITGLGTRASFYLLSIRGNRAIVTHAGKTLGQHKGCPYVLL